MIKRFNRQLVVQKDTMDKSEENKFKQGLDGAIIKVDGIPQQAVYPIPYAQVQPDMYAIENRLDQDYDRASRRPGFRSGVSTPTRTRTLGELNKIEESVVGYVGDEQDTVEEFTEEVARNLLALMRQYLDAGQVARITGDVSELDRQIFKQNAELAGGAFRFSKKNMAGEYDTEIVKGSMLPLTPQMRINFILQMARFGPAFGLTPESLTAKYMGQAFVQEFEMKDVEKAYEMDIRRMLQPEKPDPNDQLKQVDAVSKIKNRSADTALKKSRLEGNNLSNTGKALKNADAMKGKDKGGGAPGGAAQ